jgi:hypothetical protein
MNPLNADERPGAFAPRRHAIQARPCVFMSRSSRSQAIERRNLLFTKAIRLQVSLPAASRIDHDELVSGVAAPHQERASHFPYCEAPEGAQ